MISVIIPAYNAEKMISACINSLINQECSSQEYEVIVVDDGSIDRTADIVKSFKNVKLIQQKNQGPAAARNNGANHAKGDIILFTDSDCLLEENWIKEMTRPFKENPYIIGVKGIYKTKQKELASRFVQIEYEDKYDLLKNNEYIDFVDTYSAAFKKDVFLEFGGYDTSFPVASAEDVELSFRMSTKGYKLVYNSRAIVYHIHPKSFLEYFKKKYKFAYWRMLAVKKNPKYLIKDSHTPQIMKFQILFVPFLIGSLLSSLLLNTSLWPTIGLILFFIVSTIPFTLKAYKKDKLVGLISPYILIGRSVFQFFGVFNGSINALLKDRMI